MVVPASVEDGGETKREDCLPHSSHDAQGAQGGPHDACEQSDEAYPSLSEQSRILAEASSSRQQQQRRRQQQSSAPAEQKDAEAVECTGTEGELSEDACSYCGIKGVDAVVQCLDCGRFFCNSTGGRSQRMKGPSHIIRHVVKSKHREVGLHPDRDVGNSILECFICGLRNVLQLGMIAAESKEVLVIICRDKCLLGPELAENGWDATQWQPLVHNKAFATWLVRGPTREERAGVIPVSNEEIDLLEERWANGDHATIKSVQAGDVDPVLPRTQFRYEDGIAYQRTFSQLLHEEETTAREQKTSNEWKDVAVRWHTVSKRIYADFVVEDDTVTTSLFVGDEVKMSGVLPRSVIVGGRSSTACAVEERWELVLTVTDIDKTTGRITAVPTATNGSKLKNGPWDDPVVRRYCIKVQWNDVAYKRMDEALDAFAVDSHALSPVLYDLILGRTTEVPVLDESVQEQISAPNLSPLNPSQMAAVRYALQHALTLIQGPPGTGKTLTAATLVYKMSEASVHRSGSRTAKDPILVTAPSNVAVDNLAERISATGLKVVRVYSKQRELADVQDGSAGGTPLLHLALHTLMMQTPVASSSEFLRLKKKVQEGQLSNDEWRSLRQMEMHAQMEVLLASDVVCCTCVGAGDRRLRNLDFTRVVIDEATQATEPEALIPIVQGAKQVVLIGDQAQLGPVVMNKRAKSAGLEVSLFVRLLLGGIPSHRLIVQYRMHPELAHLPSMLFYDGALQNGVTVLERQFTFNPSPPFKWPSRNDVGFPSFFYNSTSLEDISPSGTSYLNMEEAKKVERIAATLVRCGVKADQIGIITPYIGQRNYLQLLLQRMPALNTVEISSIDAFQGREKDFIIFSCVRSNISEGIGFLSDARRVNVALTRARYGMILCGNAHVLSTDLKRPKNWQYTVETAEGDDSVSMVVAASRTPQYISTWAAVIRYYANHQAVLGGIIGHLQPIELSGARSRWRLGATSRSFGGSSKDMQRQPEEDRAEAAQAASCWQPPVTASQPVLSTDYPLPAPQGVPTAVSATVSITVENNTFEGSRFDF